MGVGVEDGEAGVGVGEVVPGVGVGVGVEVGVKLGVVVGQLQVSVRQLLFSLLSLTLFV